MTLTKTWYIYKLMIANKPVESAVVGNYGTMMELHLFGRLCWPLWGVTGDLLRREVRDELR